MHAHGEDVSRADRRRVLAAVLALTLGFGVVEVVGGWLTGSLALLADAAHMAGDALSLGIAVGAAALAGRPATPRRSFGFARAEVLAALANGVLLVAVAVWVLWEAVQRLDRPPEVLGGWMLVVALAGLGVNAFSALLLHRRGGTGVNVRAALRHVLADLLGSAGVVVAALVVLSTGWERADPLVGGLVGLLVAASAWGVLRESLSILLEATPPGIDAEALGRAMAGSAGVVEVHDLHVWTITSGFTALSAHVLVAPGADCHGIRRQLEGELAAAWGITHTTLQVDHAPAADATVRLGDVTRRDAPL